MMMKSSLTLQRTVNIRKKYTFCKFVSEVSSYVGNPTFIQTHKTVALKDDI